MGECSLNTSLQGVAMKVVLPLLVCAIALAAVASAKPQLGEYLERAKKPGGKPGGKPGKPGNAGGKPGKPGKPGMEEKGLCLSTDEVSILCMSNTEFGTKFGGVYHSCMEDNEEEEGEEERAKKPGKPGKPSKPGKPNKPGKAGKTRKAWKTWQAWKAWKTWQTWKAWQAICVCQCHHRGCHGKNEGKVRR